MFWCFFHFSSSVCFQTTWFSCFFLFSSRLFPATFFLLPLVVYLYYYSRSPQLDVFYSIRLCFVSYTKVIGLLFVTYSEREFTYLNFVSYMIYFVSCPVIYFIYIYVAIEGPSHPPHSMFKLLVSFLYDVYLPRVLHPKQVSNSLISQLTSSPPVKFSLFFLEFIFCNYATSPLNVLPYFFSFCFTVNIIPYLFIILHYILAVCISNIL